MKYCDPSAPLIANAPVTKTLAMCVPCAAHWSETWHDCDVHIRAADGTVEECGCPCGVDPLLETRWQWLWRQITRRS